jgi:membrane protease YdiL (CAAX protease family)
VVYVRMDAGGPSRACDPAELAADGGTHQLRAYTSVAVREEGPFAPLAVAIEREPALRDAFARALGAPSLIRWARARPLILGLSAIPLLTLLARDRGLLAVARPSGGSWLIDLLLAVWIPFELTRRTPRMPGVAAVALFAVAMRWVLVAIGACGVSIDVTAWGAAAIAVGAGLTILARAPSRERVALELLDRLGISPSESIEARRSPAPATGLIAAAVAAAAGMPALAWMLRRSAMPQIPQAIALVAFAVVVPELARRFLDVPAASTYARRVGNVLLASAIGVALTAALVHGSRDFFDAGSELARCTGKLDAGARALLARDASGVARQIATTRASTGLVLLTALVMPFAEERIFRDLLMRTLVRSYGRTYGLFASSVAFGVAHVGIHEMALYQTVLLGVGLGTAYAEGGLLASFVVHAAWNLLTLFG